MSETTKTIAFVALGLIAIGAGLLTRPTSADLDVETLVGTELTKKFSSPEDATRLRIVRFDEETATLRDFEVAEEDSLWLIPSKDGYPADASRQMAEAATSLMNRKILAVTSQGAGDHEQYGVIDPLSPKIEVGQKGVGTRVTMSDTNNDPLADLIIGKAVKDAEGQRYVREAGRDVVYVIEMDPTKLSINFEDWIEKDLLKLNPLDLQQVEIKDYSAELVPGMTPDGRLAIQVAWDPRSELTLNYHDSDGKWLAKRLAKFDPQTKQHVDFALGEDEELNETSLGELKSALDDLAIVDVVRKPQGLSNDLKAGGDFLNNPEAQRDLLSKGFVTASAAGSGGDEIISSDGEVISTLKNGTEYVLRFGNLTNVSEGEKKDEAASEEGAVEGAVKDVPAKGSDVHRYLFVMARFNEAAIEKPEIEQLPELPADAPAESGTTAETEPADAAESSGEPVPPKEAETPAETPAETQPTAEVESAKAAEPPGETAPAGDAAAATDETNAKTKELEQIIAERKRIETENQRKLDAYQESLKKGQENVKDLNARFGDWYFVVANDVFNKIRLNKDNVIKKKEPPKTDAGPASTGESDAGAPGTAIPGLPEIPGTSE